MTVPTDVPSGPPARRTRLRRAGVVAVVVSAVVLAVLLWPGGDDGRSGAASSPASTAPPQPPTPAAPAPAAPTDPLAPEEAVAPPAGAPDGPPLAADELPPNLEPVPLDSTAAVGDGVTASIEAIEAIEGAGTGPGNIGGPALRVGVRIVNGTAAPIALDAVAVTLTTGSELAPASSLDDPSAVPFGGALAPGRSAVGTYVFTVPEGARERVTVSVGYQPGAPYLVFTGSAG